MKKRDVIEKIEKIVGKIKNSTMTKTKYNQTYNLFINTEMKEFDIEKKLRAETEFKRVYVEQSTINCFIGKTNTLITLTIQK